MSHPAPEQRSHQPSEALAYVALASAGERADAIAVVDVAGQGSAGPRIVGVTELPGGGNELQRLGWSAPAAAERRRLLAPGLRSSCIHVLECERDPRRPAYVRAIAVRRTWEAERGAPRLAGDLARHDAQGVVITGEWGGPRLVLDGVSLACLAAGAYGHALHVWDAAARTHRQRIELGAEEQMVLDLRPAHSPRRAYGFACTAVNARDLSSSVFTWYLDREGDGAAGGTWRATRVIEIPAEPAPRDDLPPLLRRFGLVPPLATALALSRDDRWLYVACWGTGEVRQYDASDPFNPVLTGTVRLGGVARRAPHPSAPGAPLDAGPASIELTHDGRRAYVTSSFLTAWDAQLYPDSAGGWLAALDAGTNGGLAADATGLVRFEDGMRPRHALLRQP